MMQDICFFILDQSKKNVSFYLNLTDKRFKNSNSTLPNIESSTAQRELSQQNYDLYMGHRRLSILDVSYAGHQPMSDFQKIYGFHIMVKFTISKS